MENYRIVQKDVPENIRTEYSLIFKNGGYSVNLFSFDGNGKYSLYMATEPKESKRGWTFEIKKTGLFPIKVFLPKSKFEKI